MNSKATDAARRHRMSVLSRSEEGTLRRLWASRMTPEHSMLRGPETGLLMLRGQIGGAGETFNFGEATVTRATVKLSDGSIGHAMALGRQPEKVRLAAVIDAMCTDRESAANIDAAIIEPIEVELFAADERKRQEAAATRVDFFTMVRGED